MNTGDRRQEVAVQADVPGHWRAAASQSPIQPQGLAEEQPEDDNGNDERDSHTADAPIRPSVNRLPPRSEGGS